MRHGGVLTLFLTALMATTAVMAQDASQTLTFVKKSDFLAADAISGAVQFVHVLSVNNATPGAVGIAITGLTYARGGSAPSGVYGEVARDGIYWEPLYDTNPINVGQFGAPNDGDYDRNSGLITGTDAAPEIQAAVDFALVHNLPAPVLPCCRYRIDDTIHLGYGETFHEIGLIGSINASYNGNLAGVVLYPTKTDRPAINVQGVISARISGIGIFGQNFLFGLSRIAAHSFPSTPDAWLDPSLAASGATPGGLQPRSPYAGITIDAYSGPAPDAPYPAVAYPAWTGLKTQYNKLYSSTVELDHVNVRGFAVDVLSHPNSDIQGDFLSITNSDVGYGPFGVACGNSQSRNIELHNIHYAAVWAFLDNSSFGPGSCQLGGPIDNINGAQSYQTFNIAAPTFSGPILVTHLYTEAHARLGLVGPPGVAQTRSSFICDACNLHFGDSLTGIIPAAVVEASVNQNVEFHNSDINNYSRIGNLVHGASTIVVDGGQFAHAPTHLIGANGNPAHQAALNYSGGMLVGNADVLAPSTAGLVQGRLEWRGNTFAPYLSAPTGPALMQTLATDLQWRGRDRAAMTQATRGFVDTQNRNWRILVKPTSTFNMADARIAPVAPTYKGDTMTFGYSTALSNNPDYAIHPGDLLVNQNSGTIFLVETVGEPSGGARMISTTQQNNISVDSSGAWTANLNPDPTLAGNNVIARTGVVLPRQVEFGAFTAGSPTVANVSRGDGSGADITTWLHVGDRLTGYKFNDPFLNWPIPNGATISGVVNGSPGEVTLSDKATSSGRAPIYPIPIQ